MNWLMVRNNKVIGEMNRKYCFFAGDIKEQKRIAIV